MIMPTPFEQSIINHGPSLFLRLTDYGPVQLVSTPVAVTMQKSPAVGVALVPSDGIFGDPSLRFQGGAEGSNGNYIRISKNPAIMPTAALTISVVLGAARNPPTSSKAVTVCGCTEQGGYSLAIATSGQFSFYVYVGGSYLVPSFDRNIQSSTGNIVHATFDGRYARIYLDGILKNTVDKGSISTIGYNPTNDFLIAAEIGANNVVDALTPYLDADFSHMAIFGLALSQAQITEQAAAFLQAKELSGTAVLDDGSAAASVVISEWSGKRKGSVVPGVGGAWQAAAPAGDYLVTALGPAGYRPISHGPVTAVDP